MRVVDAGEQVAVYLIGQAKLISPANPSRLLVRYHPFVAGILSSLCLYVHSSQRPSRAPNPLKHDNPTASATSFYAVVLQDLPCSQFIVFSSILPSSLYLQKTAS